MRSGPRPSRYPNSSLDTPLNTHLARRTFVKAGAWSVPVVATAAAAPAFANVSPEEAPPVTINGAGPVACSLITVAPVAWSGHPNATLHIAFNAPIATYELPYAVNDHTIPTNAPQGVKSAITGKWVNHYAVPAGTELTMFIGAKSQPTFYYWFEDGGQIYTPTGDPDGAVAAGTGGGTPGGSYIGPDGRVDPPRFYFNNKAATQPGMNWSGSIEKSKGYQEKNKGTGHAKIRFKDNEGSKHWSCSWSAINPTGAKESFTRDDSSYPGNNWPVW